MAYPAATALDIVNAQHDTAGLHTRLLLAVVCLAVFLAALALRWPNAALIPAFTDETDEIRLAYRIARGEVLPLTNDNSHIGVVHPYLMALVFRLFGPGAALARGMMAVAGALLTALTAWLAWAMAAAREQGPGARGAGEQGQALPAAYSLLLAGLLAGALTATSFPLIVLNSHVAWSNCLTPLFTTAALGLTWAAATRAHPWWLVGAGAAWGLALQTHPIAIGPLLGCAAWAAWQPTGRRWLSARWPWLSGAAFLLAYGNMLWFNLTSGGRSLAEAVDPKRTFSPITGLGDYLGRLADVALQLSRMLAGAYVPFDGQNAPVVVTPLTPIVGLLALAALIWAARRPATSVLTAAAVSTCLVLPLFSDGFQSLYQTRFLAPVLPLVYVALALAALDAVLAAAQGQHPARLVNWLVMGAAVLLTLVPLARVWGFYVESQARGLTNAPLFAVAGAAHEAAGRGFLVMLDKDVDDAKLGGGGGPYRALHLLLTLDETSFQAVKGDKIRYFTAATDDPLLLILGEKTLAQLDGAYPLTPAGHRIPSYATYTVRAPR